MADYMAGGATKDKECGKHWILIELAYPTVVKRRLGDECIDRLALCH